MWALWKFGPELSTKFRTILKTVADIRFAERRLARFVTAEFGPEFIQSEFPVGTNSGRGYLFECVELRSTERFHDEVLIPNYHQGISIE